MILLSSQSTISCLGKGMIYGKIVKKLKHYQKNSKNQEKHYGFGCWDDRSRLYC